MAAVVHALLLEVLAVIENDRELRDRMERLLAPIVDNAVERALAAAYVDRNECARLGLEWRAVRRSGLPAFRVGRKLVYRRQDVAAWVEACQAAPNAPPRVPRGADASADRGDAYERALARAGRRPAAANGGD